MFTKAATGLHSKHSSSEALRPTRQQDGDHALPVIRTCLLPAQLEYAESRGDKYRST